MTDSTTFDNSDLSGQMRQSDLTALQELLSTRLGSKVIYRRNIEILQNNANARPRRYSKHEFSIGRTGRTLTVFLKSGMHRRLWGQLEDLHVYLSKLHIPDFRVPYYYGCLNLGHADAMRIIGVWEYVPNERAPRPSRNWRASADKLARAAAAMTALTEEVRRAVPRLRATPVFLRPVAQSVDDALTHYYRSHADLRSLGPKVAKLARMETAALERLASLGGGLTHNDYRIENVFLNGEDQPIIFDWDTASYGPPGATLRVLARRPEQELSNWIKIYCEHLKTKGWACAETEVVFSIRATEVFHALAFGTQISDHPANPGQVLIRWGLENLDYLSS